MRQYYVYILASKSRTLYTGVTNNLHVRLLQHRQGQDGFTSRYRITELVYYTIFDHPRDAIQCEKRIKSWTRAKRVALIRSVNPKWRDLSADWLTAKDDSSSSSPQIPRCARDDSAALLRMTAAQRNPPPARTRPDTHPPPDDESATAPPHDPDASRGSLRPN
jgi:putative endonuclease